MKLLQKRFGNSTVLEIKDDTLVVESKSFGTKGRMKIPLAFIGEEYFEHQERSRGWIFLAALCGLSSAALVIFSVSVEQEARGPVLGLAIILGVVAALSVRSHVLRNIDGLLFVRTDTGGAIFMHREIPSRDVFEAFLTQMLSAIREQKKRPIQITTDNSGASPLRV